MKEKRLRRLLPLLKRKSASLIRRRSGREGGKGGGGPNRGPGSILSPSGNVFSYRGPSRGKEREKERIS